jgi:hypothetical protein
MPRKRKKRKSRLSGGAYIRIVRRMIKSGKAGHHGEWSALARRASAYRKRLIAANRAHPAPRPVTGKACAMMDAESRRLYAAQSHTKDGKRVASLFKKFWGLPCPPSVKTLPGGPKGKTIPIMGMGYTREVILSDKDKGQRGGKRRTVRGQWTVATEKTGRHVIMLNKRPISGTFKPVGFAPETYYIPPPDVERAGTHKANFKWRHKHGVDDEKKNIPESKLRWPRVYADRGGKVDGSSNFMYGKTPTAKIREWMYGN